MDNSVHLIIGPHCFHSETIHVVMSLLTSQSVCKSIAYARVYFFFEESQEWIQNHSMKKFAAYHFQGKITLKNWSVTS